VRYIYGVIETGRRDMTDQIRKLSANIFRITLTDDRFGQVRNSGKEWHAEVRRTHDGALVRYAGIWGSRKDAIEELQSINPIDL
jgi:hypothetical protein